MKNVVLKTYKKKSQALLNVFAASICQLMSADPQFVSLKSDIEALKTANDAFFVSIANALRGSQAQTNIKNDCYAVVIECLDWLAHSVDGLAKGDERVARSAGFDTPGEIKSINDIAMPVVEKAENDPEHTGAASFKLKVDKNAVNTGVEYQKEGETVWQNGTFTTSSTVTVTGLEAKVSYNFRFYSNGRKSLQSDKTEPVSVLVS